MYNHTSRTTIMRFYMLLFLRMFLFLKNLYLEIESFLKASYCIELLEIF